MPRFTGVVLPVRKGDRAKYLALVTKQARGVAGVLRVRVCAGVAGRALRAGAAGAAGAAAAARRCR
jgi:hypothetical protein